MVEVVKLLQPKFFLRFETMFSVPLPKDSSLCWFWEKSQYAGYYGYVAVNVLPARGSERGGVHTVKPFGYLVTLSVFFLHNILCTCIHYALLRMYCLEGTNGASSCVVNSAVITVETDKKTLSVYIQGSTWAKTVCKYTRV